MDSCIFCQIVAKILPAELVYEDDHVLAFPDIRPIAPTHILVIPKKHIASLREAESDDLALMGHLLMAGQTIALQQGLSPDGFRAVMNVGDNGGQTVYHLHLHILGGRQLHWPPG